MAAGFKCPNCGQLFRLTPQMTGKSVRCTRCGTVFQVSAGQRPAASTRPKDAPSHAEAHASEPLMPVLDPLDGLIEAAAAAPIAPLAPVGRGRRMSQGDRVLLGVGAALAATALLGVLVLFPVLGGASVAATTLVMLVGAGGAGMMAAALRRQLPIACTLAGVVAGLLLLGAVLSTRSPGEKAPQPATEPQVAIPAAAPSPVEGRGADAKALPSAPPPPAATASTAAGQGAVQEQRASTPAPAVAVASPAAPAAIAPAAGAPAAASPLPAQPLPVAIDGKTPLIGGSQDGASFEYRVQGAPITAMTFEKGKSADGWGFTQIRPARTLPRMAPPPPGFPALLETVTARPGYAVGGINVDAGANHIRAVQFVFMRLGSDGRLDPNDTYATDWIGQPTGPIQKLSSSGGLVVGVHGRRMGLIRSIGLILPANEAAMVSTEPGPLHAALSTAPGVAGTPGAGPGSSALGPAPAPGLGSGAPLASPPSAIRPDAPPPAAAEAASPALPQAVLDALDSTVLVEHPLGSGSGFAVAKNIVATNAHVVEGAFPEEIKIRHGKENTAPRRIARVLHFDSARDLCLMEGDMDLKALEVRADYVLRPGDPVVLLGNPSVKGGILMRNVTHRGRLRTLVHADGQDLYHIDADVNPGWSGGPVLDDRGRVIAVVVMKASDDAVGEIRSAMRKLDDSFRAAGDGTGGGIAYGIPASALAKVLEAARSRTSSA